MKFNIKFSKEEVTKYLKELFSAGLTLIIMIILLMPFIIYTIVDYSTLCCQNKEIVNSSLYYHYLTNKFIPLYYL